jgi:hypothetical protein
MGNRSPHLLRGLRNPDADAEAVDNAEQEILRVARIADAFNNAILTEINTRQKHHENH